MNIAIIGSGNIGGGLGRAWTPTHKVTFGVRDSAKEVDGITAASIADAARGAEVIVLAVPYNAASQVVSELGVVDGKVIIDCTNAVGVTLPPGMSSAAQVIAASAKGAHVVKAFNTQGAENLSSPMYGSTAASVFYCGDDAAAKAKAKQLIADIGLDPVDVGGLDNARYVEAMASLWFAATKTLGTRRAAFRLLRDG